jgi:glycerophosphoryl diester phosphodiesterase
MRSSRSATDPLDPGPLGFAHRGLHRPGVPENSLAAFRAALDLGAGIECDVRLSGDGEVMVVHDPDLARLCGSPLEVEATRAEVLGAQRLLGTHEQIPWLGELLDLVQGQVPLLIEAKTRNRNAARLAQAIARDLGDYAGPVGVMSFDPKVARWLARNVPYRSRGLVVSDRSGRLERWSAILSAAPHFVAVQRTLLGTPWAAKVRRKHHLYSWTIRTAEERAQGAVHADALIWEADGRPRT